MSEFYLATNLTKGIENFLGDLEELQEELETQAPEILKRSAEPILEIQKKLVPVDSGDLKEHLHIFKPTENKKTKRFSIAVGIDLFKAPKFMYGRIVEFGRLKPTNKHGKKQGTTTPQPFIRPSATLGEARGMEIMENELNQILDKYTD